MARNSAETSQGLTLSDFIPAQIPQESIKIDSGKTTGHIAYTLKIDLKWLQESLMNQRHNGTISIKNPGEPGTINQAYFWGEPRVGDEFSIIAWDKKYYLYRKRGEAVIFMEVPNEKVDPIKKKLRSLVDSIENSAA